MSERKTKTIKVGGNADYAKVPDRLKEFWEENPHGKVETEHSIDENGIVIFKAWIWRRKDDYMEMLKHVKDFKIARGSSDANGTAQSITQTSKKDKDFEKLETVAIGRALAILGYLSSGEIASLEEMENYEDYKRKQTEEAIQEAVMSLESASNLDELKKAFIATGMMQIPEVVAIKDRRKNELMKPEVKGE